MDFSAINLSGWPVWLLATLIVIDIFKRPLSTYLPEALRDYFRHRADQADAKLNSTLQSGVTADMREARKDNFIMGELSSSLKGIGEDMKQVRLNGERTNGLLTGMNANLAKLTDLLTDAHQERQEKP